MNKELKDKWVAALRSGKYVQGTGNLQSGGRYCCLGVLCDVAGVKWIHFCDDGFLPVGGALGTLTELQKIQYGMRNGDNPVFRGSYPGGTVTGTLVEMNDDGNKSFAEIADWIETYL